MAKSRPKHSFPGPILIMSQHGPYVLRSHRPSDMKWVVQLHNKVRLEEFGFSKEFEAMVEGVVTDFVKSYDPKREHCWIAEIEGEPVGCVFLIKKSNALAQLRLLLVDSRARGLGIGGRLVEECVLFARKAGYHKIILGTNDIAVAARHLYEKAGFRLIESKPRHVFGHDMADETWALGL